MQHDNMIGPLFPDELSGASTDIQLPAETGGDTIEIVPSINFDYSQYEPAVAAEIRDAVHRIRGRGQAQNAAIAEFGAALFAVREKVGHGNWMPWLKAEFDVSISTTERYTPG